jgi:hypothetical protein
MKLKLVLAQFILITAITPAVHAKITGLPKGLPSASKKQIESSAAEELAEIFGCDFSASDIKGLKAEYVVTESEAQDEDNAEYPGELSAFVLNVKMDLPAQLCKQSGIKTCDIKFDLYDENAYEVDSKVTTCK